MLVRQPPTKGGGGGVYHYPYIKSLFTFVKLKSTNIVAMASEPTNDLQAQVKRNESLFYLMTPLEHIEFHIIGYWMSIIFL